jgi:hypothetical protein
MKYFQASELDAPCQDRLAAYDRFIRGKVGVGYPHPLRMRDWELDHVLSRLPAAPVFARKTGATRKTNRF